MKLQEELVYIINNIKRWESPERALDIINDIKKKKLDIDLKSYYDRATTLTTALDREQPEIAKELIKLGADVNFEDRNGNTPLIIAIMNWYKEIEREKDRYYAWSRRDFYFEIIKLLIEAGANLNIGVEHRKTLETFLFTALYLGHIQMAEKLIKGVADLNAKDSDGNTPLIIALDKEYIEIAEKLIGAAGVNINVQNNRRDTALTIVLDKSYRQSQEWHIQMAEKLIKLGAKLNVEGWWGNTPLMIALKNGYIKIAEELIELGADVNVQNWDGDTALTIALSMGYIEIAEKLIEAGAKLNVQDHKGDTALTMAVNRGYMEIAEELIVVGADLHIKDMYKYYKQIVFAMSKIKVGKEKKIKATKKVA